MREKWQLFHATDFESLMYPSFIFCNILGIFPYKINASTFEISKPRYIFSTVVTCVCFIGFLIILYMIDVCGIVSYSLGVPRTLERNCFYILSTFIVIVTYILSGPRMRLLQIIMEISSKLPPESYQKLSRLIHAKDILGTSLVVIMQLSIFFFVNIHIILKVFFVYVCQMMFQIDMLYMNCVCVLKACFERINDDLEHMRKLMMDDEMYYLGQIKQKSPFLLIKLKALEKQHLVISNAMQMLNKIFSLQLLTNIILSFTEITFMLYFCVLYWRDGIMMFSVPKHMYNVFLIICAMYYLIKIMLIIWACETGKNQALQISTTIHDVLNNTDDNKIKKEVIKNVT